MDAVLDALQSTSEEDADDEFMVHGALLPALAVAGCAHDAVLDALAASESELELQHDGFASALDALETASAGSMEDPIGVPVASDISDEDIPDNLDMVPYYGEPLWPEGAVVESSLSKLAWLARCSSDDSLHLKDMLLAEHFTTHEGPVLTDTTSAIIAGEGVSRRKLSYHRGLTAAAALQIEREAWRTLEQTIVDGCSKSERHALFLYMEAGAYDGVDMQVRSKRRVEVPCVKAGTGDEIIASTSAAFTLPSKTDDGRCKLLQTEYHQIMAFLDGDHCHVIVGSQLMPLQLSNRTTGECMAAMVKEHSMGKQGHTDFPRRIRNLCTDRYMPNFIGEAELVNAESREDIDVLHVPCHAHIGASGVSSVSKMCKSEIDGMKNYITSVRAPGEMQKFRNAACAWLWKNLHLIDDDSPYARLPQSAVDFKRLVMDILLPHDVVANRQIRWILECCAPGDWRRINKFIFVVKSGTSRDAVFKFISENLFYGLFFNHTPFKYPDAKWTGADKTFRDCGLPMNIHGTLQNSWFEYMLRYHANEVPAHVKAAFPVGAPALMILDTTAGSAWAGMEEGAAADDSTAPPLPPPPGAEGGQSWANFNKGQRGAAHRWMTQRSALMLLTNASLLSPFFFYLVAELHVASDAYAARRWSCRVGTAKSDMDALLGSRKWPLLQAATGALDRECTRQLELHQKREHFEALPDLMKTVNFRHHVFKATSRMSAYLHEQLGLLHSLPPFDLLLLVSDTSGEARVLARCDSMRDSFSRGFIKYWSDHGGITCKHALLELCLVIIFGRTNTCRIESLNALLRRMASCRYQARSMTVFDLSSKFILSRLQLRKRSFYHPPGMSAKFAKRVKTRAKKDKANKKGGGGAWRAWVRKCMKGKSKILFKSLALEYRHLSEQELCDLNVVGRAATEAHSLRKHAFGLTTRAMSRLLSSETLKKRCKELLTAEPPVVVSYDLSALGDHLEQAKVDAHVMQTLQNEAKGVSDHSLAEWSTGPRGVCDRDQTAMSIPNIARMAPEFHALPAACGVNIMSWCSSTGQDLHRTLAMLKKAEHSEVRDALMKWYSELHLATEHDAQPAIPPRPPLGAGKPSCREAKTCLCGAVGTAIHRFKRQLCSTLKLLIKREARLVTLQENADIVMRLTGLNDDGVVFGTADEFLHISLMKWSPYSPSARLMRRCGVNLVGNIELEGQEEYTSIYELCKTFYLRWPSDEVPRWQLRLYVLVKSERPLVFIDGRIVEVELLSSAAGAVWDAGRTHAEKVGDALDAIDDEVTSNEQPDGSSASDADGAVDHAPFPAVEDDQSDDEILEVGGSVGIDSAGDLFMSDVDLESLHGCASPLGCVSPADDEDRNTHLPFILFFILFFGALG
jgi:hypothetical protein